MRGELPGFNEQLNRNYKHTSKLIDRALQLYGLDELAFSFNGGKDSTAVLHLLLSGVQRWCHRHEKAWQPSLGLCGLHTFFFRNPDEFDEVISFVEQCDLAYHLQVKFFSCDFKHGLQQLLAETNVKAIFIGTRHGDPNCQDQDFFCPSSEGWPLFMRINPVLNWAYEDIWAYLGAVGAQHCSLYDHGYTSLGNVHDTVQNSALRRVDGTFAPAHMLPDGRLERVGRLARSARHCRVLGAALSHSAAIVTIGDELLSGKVRDENMAFLLQELHAIGWQVSRCLVLPDSEDVIAGEIKRLRDMVEIVITCGGIGPTADDRTMAALAAASGVHLAAHADLTSMLNDYFGSEISEAHLKMALTPEGHTELIRYDGADGKPSPFPLLKVDNVFVLPGVPSLVKQKFEPLSKHLQAHYGGAASHFHNRVLCLQLADEAKIAGIFHRLQEEFPDVQSGSYPGEPSNADCQLFISLESKEDALLQQATARFQELLAAHPDSSVADSLVSVEANMTSFAR